MEEILNFFKIFKLRDIIETTLIMIIIYLIIDMFNIPTLLLQKYGINIIKDKNI